MKKIVAMSIGVNVFPEIKSNSFPQTRTEAITSIYNTNINENLDREASERLKINERKIAIYQAMEEHRKSLERKYKEIEDVVKSVFDTIERVAKDLTRTRKKKCVQQPPRGTP